jgi:hypothetical protein
MKTSSMENLLKLVKKHNLNTNLSLEALLDQLTAVSSEHAHLVNSVNEIVSGSKYLKAASPEQFLTECPNCHSHTLLNFTECHLCGESLIAGETEEVKPEPKAEKKKAEVKPEPKKEEPKKKAAPKVEEPEEDEYEEVESPYKKKNTKDQVIADDEDEDLDLEVEEPKKASKVKEAPKGKSAPKKPAKEEEDELDFDDEEEVKPAKTKKAKAPVKETLPEEEDELDIDFDDEEEEAKPAPKADKKKAVKEEPKKAAPKADKKAAKKTDDDELGELNEDFDLSDFEEEDDSFGDDADTDFDE